MLRTLIALSFSVLISLNARAGVFDFFDVSEIGHHVRTELLKSDINFSVSLPDIVLASGLKESIGAGSLIQSSYLSNKYMLVQRVDLNPKVDLGSLFPHLFPKHVGSSISHDQEFIYARQFDDEAAALGHSLSIPTERIPTDAKRALETFREGEFVSFPATLSLSVGFGNSWAKNVNPLAVNASAGISYSINGSFEIQIFKIDKTHVRLKIISSTGHSHGFSAGANENMAIVSISQLNRAVNRLFDHDLASINLSINPSSQYILDYLFDLSYKESQDAYDEILKNTYRFKDIIAAESQSAYDLMTTLATTHALADKLAEEDVSKCNKRIVRLFSGINDFVTRIREAKLGIILASYNNQQTYTDNQITYFDRDDIPHHFFYPVSSHFHENRLGVKFLNANSQAHTDLFGLIPYSDDPMNDPNSDFGLTYERYNRILDPLEWADLRDMIINQIPSSIRGKIDWGEWGNSTEKKNVRIFAQLVLKSPAFEYLRYYSEDEIEKRLSEYVMKRINTADSTPKKFFNFLLDALHVREWEIRREIHTLAKSLYLVLSSPDLMPKQRIKRLLDLREQTLFDSYGMGFLLSLVPKQKLDNLIFFKLDLIAAKVPEINFHYGNLEYEELYNELYLIQSRLNNRSYDLRLRENGKYDDKDTDMACTSTKDVLPLADAGQSTSQPQMTTSVSQTLE